MTGLVLAAVAAAQIIVTSFMEPPPRQYETNNVVAWSALPTMDELYAAYPKGEHGRATVAFDCAVGKVGELKGCEVYEQTPQHVAAFGDAALTLARYFRVRPDYAEAIQLAGSRVSVKLTLVRRGDDDTLQGMAHCAPPYCGEAPTPPPPSARCPPPGCRTPPPPPRRPYQ
jgi:hypothetical protein